MAAVMSLLTVDARALMSVSAAYCAAVWPSTTWTMSTYSGPQLVP